MDVIKDWICLQVPDEICKDVANTVGKTAVHEVSGAITCVFLFGQARC